MSTTVLTAVVLSLIAIFGVGFFVFKTLTSELQKVRETLTGETNQNRTSLEEAMTRSRMETRQTLQFVIDDLQTRLGGLQSSTENRLEIIRTEVDKKLSETITKNFESFGAVSKRLEELQAVTSQVVSLSQGVRDLTRILESPKLRGSMGEFQLSEMLKQVLPEDAFFEQYAIEGKSKETVDAVIKLKEGYLCIDSKFPLNNARLLLEGTLNEDESKVARKAFAQDVKAMVDSISEKYIIPEKTLDFAFMFIPAESVFYELLKDSVLHQYCLKKHVIPVSPNSFYAYLQAIAVGFRGLKIQAEAKKIEATLIRLKNDFQKFQVDFSKVGKHLKDAQTQYDNVENRVERFGVIIGRLGLEQSKVDPVVEPPLLDEGPQDLNT
ncbi:MAG: DNA recombination protein RmuC [Oligoflexia bacterium]|nr:DNA recombination protein RmuC [Oligoflexia bacterium]